MFRKRNPHAVLDGPLAKAGEVIAERTRIEAAIARTGDEAKAVEAELDRALEVLAAVEAAAALADDAAGQPDTAPQRAVVQNLRSRIEALHARRRGLDRKLAETEGRVLDCHDALASARDDWRAAWIGQFAEEFYRTAENLSTVLRKGLAVADALAADGLGMGIREIKVRDPINPGRLLTDMEPVRFNPECGMSQHYPAWQDDTAAADVFHSLTAVRVKSEALNKLAAEIRERRGQEVR
jgi:hypothetical protein